MAGAIPGQTRTWTPAPRSGASSATGLTKKLFWFVWNALWGENDLQTKSSNDKRVHLKKCLLPLFTPFRSACEAHIILMTFSSGLIKNLVLLLVFLVWIYLFISHVPPAHSLIYPQKSFTEPYQVFFIITKTASKMGWLKVPNLGATSLRLQAQIRNSLNVRRWSITFWHSMFYKTLPSKFAQQDLRIFSFTTSWQSRPKFVNVGQKG